MARLPPLMPRWAWGVPSKDSFLAHVNRRYYWHRGRLLALRVQAHILRPDIRIYAIMAIDAELDTIRIEFNQWKDQYEATR